MTGSAPQLQTFAYSAQANDGRAVSGTIDAADADAAARQLASMGLKVLELSPAAAPPKPRPLRGDDFVAFNQQLAQLTAAGLPLEHGLRLIAEDMGGGRLAQTVRLVADDLESGRSLPEAFERHRSQFPPLYANLVGAGVRSGNLPAMLLNLGRHALMVQRLRAAVWRASAYPIGVLIMLGFVLVFLFLRVVPAFEASFKDFRTELPAITRVVLGASHASGAVVLVLIVAAAVALLALLAARFSGNGPALADKLLLPLPLIGPALRRSLIARWCDAVRIGVEAGMDLPAAIDVAGDAAGSPAAKEDGRAMVAALSEGRPLTHVDRPRVLPRSAAAVIEMGAQRNDLPGALAGMADLYQQQAEVRLAVLQAVLTPALLLFIGILIGLFVLAVAAPLITLVESVSG